MFTTARRACALRGQPQAAYEIFKLDAKACTGNFLDDAVFAAVGINDLTWGQGPRGKGQGARGKGQEDATK